MEQSMTGSELEFKYLFMGAKFIGVCIFVWFIQPIIGFVTIPFETAIGVLTPNMRATLDDVKLILAVVVPSLLAIKYIIDIVKSRKNKTKR